MRIKRFMALLLAVMMVLSLAACGEKVEPTDAPKTTDAPKATEGQTEPPVEELYYNTDTYFPIVNEEITISIAGRTESSGSWEDSHVFKKIKEEMGINLEAIEYIDATVEKNQFVAALASDTLPDLMISMPAITKAQSNQYGEEGYLLNLMDYIDIMPNFAKFLEENPEFKDFHMTEDGAIYSFDRIRPYDQPQDAIYVSKEDQEKYGFSVDDIKTVDDFYNVLKSIKEQNPDVIPWGVSFSSYGNRGLFNVQNGFGLENRNMNYWRDIDEDGNVYLNNISDNAKAFFIYMNKLWEEELIDQDGYILSQDEYRARVREGEYVFFFDWGLLPATLGTSDGNVWQDYDSVVSLTSEYQPDPVYIMPSAMNTAARVMVSAKTEYPEAICRLLDYHFSEEGFYFFRYGTEGETFEFVEDSTGHKVVSQEKFWDSTKYSNITEWSSVVVAPTNIFWTIQPYQNLQVVVEATDQELEDLIYNDPSYAYAADAHLEKAIRSRDAERRTTNWKSQFILTAEENSLVAQGETDIKNLITQYSAQFISGELNVETEWDSYVETIEGIWKTIQPVYQAVYERCK